MKVKCKKSGANLLYGEIINDIMANISNTDMMYNILDKLQTLIDMIEEDIPEEENK